MLKPLDRCLSDFDLCDTNQADKRNILLRTLQSRIDLTNALFKFTHIDMLEYCGFDVLGRKVKSLINSNSNNNIDYNYFLYIGNNRNDCLIDIAYQQIISDAIRWYASSILHSGNNVRCYLITVKAKYKKPKSLQELIADYGNNIRAEEIYQLRQGYNIFGVDKSDYPRQEIIDNLMIRLQNYKRKKLYKSEHTLVHEVYKRYKCFLKELTETKKIIDYKKNITFEKKFSKLVKLYNAINNKDNIHKVKTLYKQFNKSIDCCERLIKESI